MQIRESLFRFAFPKYIKIFLQFSKKRRIITMRCVRDGSGNPLCFFFKNIKIAANSPTRSCQEERRSNLQGHAQKTVIPQKRNMLFKPSFIIRNV
jgi:hypothetical protein